MIQPEWSLYDFCEVVNPSSLDRFVGLRIQNSRISIRFPLGYNLPDSEGELREDILGLISLLRSRDLQQFLFDHGYTVPDLSQKDFPLTSYLEVVQQYLSSGIYLFETESEFSSLPWGRVDWSRTIKSYVPLKTENGFFYPGYTYRRTARNENSYLTNVHKHVVYISFRLVGWLFTNSLPSKPDYPIVAEQAIQFLNQKLRTTHNEKLKQQFVLMLVVLKSEKYLTLQNDLELGTLYFENVWEFLIDRQFASPLSFDPRPTAQWTLENGKQVNTTRLRPDTLMCDQGEIFILDAKYYRFGVSGAPGDLPGASDINKQITYGDHVHHVTQWSQGCSQYGDIYNAFIVPYAGGNGPIFKPVGTSLVSWNRGEHSHQRVVLILMDTATILRGYAKTGILSPSALAHSIRSYNSPMQK